MAYEMLLDDFLEKLSEAGIDVSEIHIEEPENVDEYVEDSLEEKQNSYITLNKKTSESLEEGFASFFI